jgi:hypothetical protein
MRGTNSRWRHKTLSRQSLDDGQLYVVKAMAGDLAGFQDDMKRVALMLPQKIQYPSQASAASSNREICESLRVFGEV